MDGNNHPLKPRVIRLPRDGPLPNQPVTAWLRRKDKMSHIEIERIRWKKEHP